MRDVRRHFKFEVQKGGKHLSREKHKNGSHSQSLPLIPFKIPIKERQRNNLPQFTNVFGLDRPFTEIMAFVNLNVTDGQR